MPGQGLYRPLEVSCELSVSLNKLAEYMLLLSPEGLAVYNCSPYSNIHTRTPMLKQCKKKCNISQAFPAFLLQLSLRSVILGHLLPLHKCLCTTEHKASIEMLTDTR